MAVLHTPTAFTAYARNDPRITFATARVGCVDRRVPVTSTEALTPHLTRLPLFW